MITTARKKKFGNSKPWEGHQLYLKNDTNSKKCDSKSVAMIPHWTIPSRFLHAKTKFHEVRSDHGKSIRDPDERSIESSSF
ncbi:MAG: hypothetical protein CMI33_08385 [Opitutales bacterium]|nr:hypothetical protein [Opitutales bacterium]